MCAETCKHGSEGGQGFPRVRLPYPTAYAAAYEAQYGEAIPLAVLITTILRDYLQKDQAFMRQRRQARTPAQPHLAPVATGGGQP